MKTLRLEVNGPLIAKPEDASTLVGAAWGQEIDVIVVPVERLHEDFFTLSTGLAGAVLQKLANHRLRLAVLGDVAKYVAASDAFRDFVREANRGQQTWFVADEAELNAKLGAS